MVQSMGRVGSALDNAAAESFNSLIKVEYIHRSRFATRTEDRLKIATWITGFYNPRRRHSAAGGLPPEKFERIISEARKEHSQKHQAALPKSLRNQGIDRAPDTTPVRTPARPPVLSTA
ncbi:integrase core domain-containing protein [Streptomyces sp. NBC_00828]|uniref:integrase core domain-containing protein n=1 Tax=Streptomyces sp. NBC_00828 TaxID=2903678 RepID=UPI00386F7FF2